MKKEIKREKRQGDAEARQERGDVFDPALVERLVSLMTANDLTEINLTQGRCGIQLRRDRAVGSAAAPVPVPSFVPAAPAASAAPAAARDDKPDDSSIQLITSPMVGTFYTAPSPDKPPFVKVGDVITPETTVCIIEAMKVYNEIQGEISGKVVAVLVKNGEAVDFGMPLFKIDTRG